MWSFWIEALLIWQILLPNTAAYAFSRESSTNDHAISADHIDFTNSSDLEDLLTPTSYAPQQQNHGLPNEELRRRSESFTSSSDRVIPTTITTYFDAYSADITTLGTYYNTKSYWFGTTTSHYPILVDAITTHPNISNVDKRNISSVLQCYSSLATWRNASASFMNAKIANRTWSVTSTWSYTADSWFGSSTIYPSNPSTYKLCDGTPRVNIRPETTYMSGTTTLWASFTSTLTPTFSPQPCTPSVPDCRILYVDTNAKDVYENMLLKYCGDPVHLKDQPQCIIGGGPVELIYFPVKSDNGSLCKNDTASPKSYRPLDPNLSQITTLGHTFTSDSVYLSFSTLKATWDGFWDPVGPTFKDLIVPFRSDEISTQCGGWFNARGPGTQLNYADLNWPVPAHAYSCQQRCTLSQTSSAHLIRPTNRIQWDVNTVSPGPECDTIWSDVNPVIALPTRMKSFVSEWSTCSFWNDNLANFWFDPPKALHPASVAAEATMPVAPPTTPAAPISTVKSPAAPSTEAMTTAEPTSSADPSSQSKSSASHSQPAIETSLPASPSGDDPQNGSPEQFIIDTPAHSTRDDAPSSPAGGLSAPDEDTAPGDAATQTSINQSMQPAPAISILTEALTGQPLGTGLPAATESLPEVPATSQDAGLSARPPTANPDDASLPIFSFDPTSKDPQADASESHTVASSTPLASYIAMGILTVPAAEPSEGAETTQVNGQTPSQGGSAPVVSSGDPGTPSSASLPLFSFNPSTTSSQSGIILSLGGQTVTALPNSNGFILGTHTLPIGVYTTISGTLFEAGSGDLIIGSSYAGASLLDAKSPLTMAAGSVTLTASQAADNSKAWVIGGQTLSKGGPVGIVSGQTITADRDGLALVAGEKTAALSPVPSTATFGEVPGLTDGSKMYALGPMTVKASEVSNHPNEYVVDGTTISQGGSAMTLSSGTITVGAGGLALVTSATTERMSTIPSLPTMDTGEPSTAAHSTSASTAKPSMRTLTAGAPPEETATSSAASFSNFWQARHPGMAILVTTFYLLCVT